MDSSVHLKAALMLTPVQVYLHCTSNNDVVFTYIFLKSQISEVHLLGKTTVRTSGYFKVTPGWPCVHLSVKSVHFLYPGKHPLAVYLAA